MRWLGAAGDQQAQNGAQEERYARPWSMIRSCEQFASPASVTGLAFVHGLLRLVVLRCAFHLGHGMERVQSTTTAAPQPGAVIDAAVRNTSPAHAMRVLCALGHRCAPIEQRFWSASNADAALCCSHEFVNLADSTLFHSTRMEPQHDPCDVAHGLIESGTADCVRPPQKRPDATSISQRTSQRGGSFNPRPARAGRNYHEVHDRAIMVEFRSAPFRVAAVTLRCHQVQTRALCLAHRVLAALWPRCLSSGMRERARMRCPARAIAYSCRTPVTQYVLHVRRCALTAANTPCALVVGA